MPSWAWGLDDDRRIKIFIHPNGVRMTYSQIYLMDITRVCYVMLNNIIYCCSHLFQLEFYHPNAKQFRQRVANFFRVSWWWIKSIKRSVFMVRLGAIQTIAKSGNLSLNFGLSLLPLNIIIAGTQSPEALTHIAMWTSSVYAIKWTLLFVQEVSRYYKL